jgi:hypothetical protein
MACEDLLHDTDGDESVVRRPTPRPARQHHEDRGYREKNDREPVTADGFTRTPTVPRLRLGLSPALVRSDRGHRS